MRIFNYSKLPCDRKLWHAIADELSLNGIIKHAELFDKKELSVVIHKQNRHLGDLLYEHSSYSPPRIDIYTCPVCSSGTIFFSFIDRLACAWIYEKHEEFYFEPWLNDFCDNLATSIFTILGGSNLKKKILPKVSMARQTCCARSSESCPSEYHSAQQGPKT